MGILKPGQSVNRVKSTAPLTALCCLLSAMLVLALVPALLPHSCGGAHCGVCTCARRSALLAAPLLLTAWRGIVMCTGKYGTGKNLCTNCGSITPVELNNKLLI